MMSKPLKNLEKFWLKNSFNIIIKKQKNAYYILGGGAGDDKF